MAMVFSTDLCRTFNGVRLLCLVPHSPNPKDVLSIIIDDVASAAVDRMVRVGIFVVPFVFSLILWRSSMTTLL